MSWEPRADDDLRAPLPAPPTPVTVYLADTVDDRLTQLDQHVMTLHERVAALEETVAGLRDAFAEAERKLSRMDEVAAPDLYGAFLGALHERG